MHGLKLNSAVKDALASAHVRNAKAVKGVDCCLIGKELWFSEKYVEITK